ncbi:spore germination protein [Halalkalibacterium halodurans]|uniref:spore germination protein n=1 Tax=Halalkalibacterium halodurans TaxID=86665 RepID=UPI002E208BBE|nr:spore germination protein [Halalkalibacterium halodurans]MED4084755.1 spore germination protein [Halalkalibacterium halodurans]MED4106137.1 spore germination protein [Halalkalibacterium halodurans]MED4110670.1 spore germination protein [Halalkalibacterium halodurans]MED4124651.1 spore germination protein [Halalkalibacterium halodurans]
MSWFKLNKLKRQQRASASENKATTLADVIQVYSQSSDFTQFTMDAIQLRYHLFYLRTLVDPTTLQQDILTHLIKSKALTLHELKRELPIDSIHIVQNDKELNTYLLTGHVCIHPEYSDFPCLCVPAQVEESREISIPEVEFSVVGPKEAFVESLDLNIYLVRRRLPTSNLRIEEYEVGSLSHTRVAILYIETITNPELVTVVRNRINDIDFDHISDSSFINQLIEDSSQSPFPLLIDTERPDRVASVLAEGKVCVLTDGSPSAITGPTTLVEFFSSYEDYFLKWHIASIFRLIRLFSVLFSIFATPMYVAVLTYHPELIPQDLLATLTLSRSAIPFPPILEALFLEVTIELLREAGARLPTKVGQTIGIVGGIVIGTAAVEAGLTSNVLLIIVALAALASFTTPVYRMGNTIRLIRFPFILAAQLWGLISLVLLFCYLLVHLLTLQSLGRPFLHPIYPFYWKDLKDSFIRLPFTVQAERPSHLKTGDKLRFQPKKAQTKDDIDEGM